MRLSLYGIKLRIKRFFSNILWWFLHRFHPAHKYNFLPTGFPPGYYDPCMQIPAAIFESVHKYVEEDGKFIDWKESKGEIKAWSVFCRASTWWKINKEKVLKEGFDSEDFDSNIIKTLLIDVIKNIDHMWYF